MASGYFPCRARTTPKLAKAAASVGLCTVTAFHASAASGKRPCCSKAIASEAVEACAAAQTVAVATTKLTRTNSSFQFFIPGLLRASRGADHGETKRDLSVQCDEGMPKSSSQGR